MGGAVGVWGYGGELPDRPATDSDLHYFKIWLDIILQTNSLDF